MRALPAVVLVTSLALAGCIRSLDGFSGTEMDTPGMMFSERSALGEVLAIEPVTNATWRFVVDADAVDCQLNATRFEIVAAPREGVELPAVGERGPFVFHEDPAAGGWWFGGAYANPSSPGPASTYAQMCAGRHEQDVTVIPPGHRERASGSASQVFPSSVRLGGETRFAFRIVNAADRPLTVRIDEVALANEEAWYAPGPVGDESFTREERARAAAIAGCTAEPQNATFEVGAESQHVFEVSVACADDADARPTYRTCEDQYARPGVPGSSGYEPPADASCRDTEAERPYAVLWMRHSFVDELGARHERADAVMTMLHVARPATLTIEAPAAVRDRDDVVVLARYADGDGRPIRTAQVSIGLDYPGLENSFFGMTWDDAAGAYRFRWDDMMERKPLVWREGPHRVTVDALDGTYEHEQRTASTVVEFQ